MILLSGGQLLSFVLPPPSGVYTDLLKMRAVQSSKLTAKKLELLGIEEARADELRTIREKISSPFGDLVAVKFTLESEVGDLGVKQITLTKDLRARASLFFVDYRLFLEFLHSQIYKKAKIAKLEIPSLLFFRFGELLFPIEPETAGAMSTGIARIEQLIRDRLAEPIEIEAEVDALALSF
jgi:hypothetical protein